jgi:calcium-dependent protein kinase
MGCGGSTIAKTAAAPLPIDTDILKRPEAEPLVKEELLSMKARNFILRNSDIQKNFLLEKQVGSGGFGQIMIAKHKPTLEKRAIKILFKMLSDEEMAELGDDDFKPFLPAEVLMNEIETVCEMDHPSIIKVYEYYETPKKYFLVTELMDKDTLHDKNRALVRIAEDKCKIIGRQLLSCVIAMHELDIIHRDLKPENVLLYKSHMVKDFKMIDFERYDQLKLIDFGFTVNKKKPHIGQNAGTPNYVAPETLNQGYVADFPVDMWAFGAVMFTVLSGEGHVEAYGLEGATLQAKLLQPIHYNETWAEISEEGQDLCKKLLVHEPSGRMSAKETWEHPFFKGVEDQLKELLPKETAVTILNNIKDFSNLNALQRASHCYISSQLISKKEDIVEFVNILFSILNADGRAKLTKQQIQAGFQDFCGAPLTDSELNSLFKNVCLNKTGEIVHSEFLVAAVGPDVAHSNETLQSVFEAFDLDQNGSLSKEEVTLIMSLGSDKQKVNNAVVEGIFQGKTELSFDDFSQIVTA